MQSLDLELHPTPRAVVEARRAVTRHFANLPPAALDDLRLLITELVSNAILHGDLGPADTVRVRVSHQGGRLHAEVIDGGSDGEIRPKPLDPTSPGGFGLYLVEELSDRWGVRHEGMTCVWFDLIPRMGMQAT